MFTQEKTRDRIDEDLQILTDMAATMPAYLDSTAVYYPLSNPALPKLTLGGYLMRQERLWALRDKLSDVDQGRLDTAVSQFQQALSERITRVEHKGHEEAYIRLRQWNKAVAALRETPEESVPYYATVVENRIMLAALITYLQQEPYKFEQTLLTDTAVVDQTLNNIWQAGAFIWPDVWQAAYPRRMYWWLYGQPAKAYSRTN